VIATSKQQNADALIAEFASGKGDILIVKQMASLGLDIPALKLALHLSAVRTQGTFIQQIMRTATIWGLNKIAHLIIPADVTGEYLWTIFVEENGGMMKSSTSQLLSTEERDKQDSDNHSHFEVIRTENAKISNSYSTNERHDDNDYNEYASPMISLIPELQKYLTDNEIIQKGKMLQAFAGKSLKSLNQETPNQPVADITSERKTLRLQIDKLTSDLSSSKYSYATHKREWICEKKRLMNAAKSNNGISRKLPLEKIFNVNQLKGIKHYLENFKNNNINFVSKVNIKTDKNQADLDCLDSLS
jgi:superfamily II DNA/RNA helicase